MPKDLSWHEPAREMAKSHSTAEIAAHFGKSVRQVQAVVQSVETAPPAWKTEAIRLRTTTDLTRQQIADKLGVTLKQVRRATDAIKKPLHFQLARRETSSGQSNVTFLTRHSPKPEHQLTNRDFRRLKIQRLLMADSARSKPPVTLPRLKFLENAA